MSDWQALGKVQYKRLQLYELPWANEVGDLQNYIICAAPFGGPIALARDERKFVLVGKGRELVPHLLIYSPSGTKMASIPWEDKRLCVIGGLGWTQDENLVCVLENGTVLLYDMFGLLLNSFPLVPPLSKLSILMVEIFQQSLVALDSAMNLVYVPRVESAQPKRALLGRSATLLDVGVTPNKVPNCMAVLPPQITASESVEVIVATQEGSLVVVDPNAAEDMKLQGRITAPIMSMAVADKGTFVACFTADGMLIVMSTKFDNKVLEFDTQTTNVPQYMVWCGEDSVVLHWKQLGLVVVGPFGDWIKYPYNVPLYPVHEHDCCRIYTSTSHEIIQRVPPSIEAIKGIGSTHPAAMLFDAMEAFESGDPKADENIRSIKQIGKLEDAVTQCIDAATSEFDFDQQRSLLRAASYGKSFQEDYDSDIFVEACKMIRVLNAVRAPKIGLPLTASQYKLLTPEICINRLIVRKHYFLAAKICDYLKVSKDGVLVNWACEKIKVSADVGDNELLNLIRKKLGTKKNISYAGIAAIAEQVGRRRLATMLLDYEPKPADQVPLLLSMKEEELALKKAIASSDVDLQYMVLLYLLNIKKSDEDFYTLLFKEGHGEAVDLLVAYYKNDRSDAGLARLSDFFLASGHVNEAAAFSIQKAYLAPDLTGRMNELSNAQQLYLKAKSTFHAKCVEEQKELLLEQRKLEEKTGPGVFFDKSVHETIYLLCTMSGEKPQLLPHAASIAKKFKVPDKSFYFTKIRALADTRQWDSLMRFANEKKPPVGYKPFAVTAYREGEQNHFEMYLQKMNNEEKFQTFAALGLWNEATDVAIRAKDADKLMEVKYNCDDTPLIQKIDDALARKFK